MAAVQEEAQWLDSQTDFISGVASDILEFASTGGSIQPIRPQEKTQEGGEIRWHAHSGLIRHTD